MVKFDPQLLRRRASPQTPAWSGAGTWNGCKNLVGAANPGHIALASWPRFAQFDLITQNIDDLHERGGSTVYHLHGSITRYRCNRCAAPYVLQPQDITAQTPPVCPRCRGLIRPDIVWFGEMLPRREMEETWRAARECEVMLVVGTSGIVYPAAQLPQLALQHGATIIEINPEPTPLTPIAGVALQAPSGEALPALLELLDAG